MNVKNICISSTFLCLCPLNISFKLNFNISKKAYFATHSGKKWFFSFHPLYFGTWFIPFLSFSLTMLYFVTALAFGSVDNIVLLILKPVHLYCFFMSSEGLTVLIFGHYFVKRLQRDLQSNFNSRADESFNLRGTASVFLHGIGVRMWRSFGILISTWSSGLRLMLSSWKWEQMT